MTEQLQALLGLDTTHCNYVRFTIHYQRTYHAWKKLRLPVAPIGNAHRKGKPSIPNHPTTIIAPSGVIPTTLNSRTHKWQNWKTRLYSRTEREHLFNLDQDPHETSDLALQNDVEVFLTPWRSRLIEILKERPEGLTDRKELIAGQPHNALSPDYKPDATYSFL